MGIILTGDQVRAFDRKLGEILRQVGQVEYPHNPQMVLDVLQGISEGRFAVTVWSSLFGHLKIWNPNFNESHFPFGVDPGDEAEEFGFDRSVTGHEAIREFGRIERRSASLWAQGRYIKADPRAQKEHALVGIGAQWHIGAGDLLFPVFRLEEGSLGVDLRSLDDELYPVCRFLLSKEKKGGLIELLRG